MSVSLYQTTMSMLKNSEKILNLCLIIISVSHISYLGYQSANPELPEIKVYKRSLDQLDFPLFFKVCIFENRNTTRRYQNVGYSDELSFFRGVSTFNESLVGWSGHSSNGSTLASVEGCNLNCVTRTISTNILEILKKVAFNWTNIITRIKLYTINNKSFYTYGSNISKLLPTIQYPSCHIIDLINFFDMKTMTPLQIFFTCGRVENLGISIFVQERNKMLKRPLKVSRLNYVGPDLKNTFLEEPKKQKVILKMSQTIDSELDEDKNCRQYPSEGFETYGECDQAYVTRKFKDVYKVMPFWATSTIDDVTNLRLIFFQH